MGKRSKIHTSLEQYLTDQYSLASENKDALKCIIKLIFLRGKRLKFSVLLQTFPIQYPFMHNPVYTKAFCMEDSHFSQRVCFENLNNNEVLICKRQFSLLKLSIMFCGWYFTVCVSSSQ